LPTKHGLRPPANFLRSYVFPPGLAMVQSWCPLLGVIFSFGPVSQATNQCTGTTSEFGDCPLLPPCHPAVDCTFGDWDEWYYAGGCIGVCFRKRDVAQYSDEWGNACVGALETSKDCTDLGLYTSNCYNGQVKGFDLFGESHCVWRDWSVWSDCSRPCGGGEKSRDRHVKEAPKYGGAPCAPLDTEEVTACNTQPCRPCIDGRWGQWGEWQPCSVSCGVGLQMRERKLEVESNECGVPASGSSQDFKPCHHAAYNSLEQEKCGAAESQRCELGQWQEWDACDQKCGFGQRSRRRPLVVGEAKHYVADLEKEVFELQENNNALEKQRDILEARMKNDQEKITSATEAQTSLASKVASLEKTRDGLAVSATNANWATKHLVDNVNVLKQEKDKLQARIIELEQTVGSLQQSNSVLKIETSRRPKNFMTAIIGCLLLCICIAMGAACALLTGRSRQQRLHQVLHNGDDIHSAEPSDIEFEKNYRGAEFGMLGPPRF